MSQSNSQNQLMELSQLQERIKALKENLDMLDTTIRERLVTAETLTNLGSVEKDQEILIPIGSGSFVTAATGKTENVLVGIGAGISIEKKREDAIKSVNTQVNEFEQLRLKLGQNLEEVTKRYQELQAQLSQLSQGAK